MFGESLANRIKRFDLYRELPKDLTEASFFGGAVSIVAVLFMALLFGTELSAYMAVTTHTEMFVDSPRIEDIHAADLQINLNVTLPHIPCAVAGVDVQDVMGGHVVDVGGELIKTRLSATGDVIPIPPVYQRDDPGFLQQVGEGCNLHGYLIVKKVPGNFHISAHSHINLMHIFFPNGWPMNTTHAIHDLSFGQHTEMLASGVGPAAATRPLKGVFRPAHLIRRISSEPPSHGHGHGHGQAEEELVSTSFEYYIKVVPTHFETVKGDLFYSYQYTASSNEIRGPFRVPAIYFRYDLSPITVKFTQRAGSFPHFLVQVCAIVGGAFTVLGLVLGMLRTSIRHLTKKAELGKLG